MAFEAKKFQDGSHRPEFDEGANGRHAVDWYRVNTANMLAARFASGLPAYGDLYDAELPLLRCYDRKFEYAHGVVDANGNGGTTHVKVLYREPADGLPLAEPGLIYMLMDGQLASQLLKWESTRLFADPPPPGGPPPPTPPPAEPIDGGKGMNVVIGEPVARVVMYPANPARYNLLGLLEAHRWQYVNTNVMRLPPIPLYGVLNRDFQPGEVQYHDFKVDYDAGMMRITHTLKFIVGGVPLDEYWWLRGNWVGDGTGAIRQTKRYKRNDLRPLLNPNP